jgi:hypothetical protein
MLAKVDNRSKSGLQTKNHLFLCLLVVRDGGIRKDHDKDSFWTVPPKDGTRHKELYEVLERGLNVLLLDKSIWINESLADIQLIIDVDNQDQITCMADHELHMFNRITAATTEQKEVANHKALFERVYEKLEAAAGPFSKKDCTALYNCASKLPGQYGQFVTKFHFHFVNPSALKVKPKMFGYVAFLGDKWPWVKVALLIMCYLCHPDFYEEVGLIQYANGISEQKLENLALQEVFLTAVEGFCAILREGLSTQAKESSRFQGNGKVLRRQRAACV